ncbi:HAMP domain-containing sensor histidine kinase [Nonomuraea sp. NPDC050404]|uniref:sensor histidine kinase n=1 Tax=Nonomuraea sp. NPDC050404 TaxID=3155783 RepID=UPI0033DB8B9D
MDTRSYCRVWGRHETAAVDQIARCFPMSHAERPHEWQRGFAADVSHELRTPLAGLRAQLEEARLHPDQTELPVLLSSTLRDLDRLETLVADLGLLAEAEAGTSAGWERVDLGELVRGELPHLSGRRTVRARLESGALIDAVPSHLRRVVGNLLDNALRHAESAVLVRVRRGDDGAELTVEDDGPGIAEQDRCWIFQAFTRLDAARGRDQGGTGLGLSLVGAIVTAHGGNVQVGRSNLGGARFTVRFPPAGSSPRRPGTDAHRPEEGSRSC